MRGQLVWLAGASVALASCSQFGIADMLVGRASRPPLAAGIDVAPYRLLAGDTHCHVTPPDAPSHVGRGLERTDEIAREEHLDFVILTPHLWDDFYADPALRELSLVGLVDLRARVDALDGAVTYVIGFEHTTGGGHSTAVFGDLAAALAAVPAEEAAAEPGRFFEAWVATGGLLFVNHPLMLAFDPDSPISNVRWDLSWAPWVETSGWREDVRAIHELAVGWEAENLGVAWLRDYWLAGRPGLSRREILRQLDRRIVREQRRMTPVGGTDSHSDHLRPMVFVLAEGRGERAIRDAFEAGRTCVGHPHACTLEARPAGKGAFARVGAALAHEGLVDARVEGEELAIVLDGRVVARPRSGETVRFRAPRDRCAVLRASASGGDSAPIYLGCRLRDDR